MPNAVPKNRKIDPEESGGNLQDVALSSDTTSGDGGMITGTDATTGTPTGSRVTTLGDCTRIASVRGVALVTPKE